MYQMNFLREKVLASRENIFETTQQAGDQKVSYRGYRIEVPRKRIAEKGYQKEVVPNNLVKLLRDFR